MRARLGWIVLGVGLGWPAGVRAQTELQAAEPAAASGSETGEAPALPPGDCPAPASQSIRLATARSDAGDARADLDLAACWRELAQPYPERSALTRALERGLSEGDAASARARLEALGGPLEATTGAAPAPEAGPSAGTGPDAASGGAAPDEPSSTTLVASVLAGVSIAGLIAGTATGLVALHENARRERELADDSLELELGVAAGVCLGVGIAAGIAALVLWPDGETGPTAGPGDVGLGWEVRF